MSESRRAFGEIDGKEIADWANGELNGSVQYSEVKRTDMSFVLKGQHGDKAIFVKAANEAAAFEAELTAFISRKFPGKSVDVLAVHKENNWMMLGELPGAQLRTLRENARYKEMLREYGALQKESIPLVNELLSIGVTDRRIPILRREIDEHLEELCRTGLDDDKTREVMGIKDELLSMCDQMEGVLPDTIDHGDLHSGNVYYDGASYRFFDWGDASITHPFLSMRVFWNSLFELNEEDTEEKWFERIVEYRPVYIDIWKEYAVESTLWKQLLLAEQLGCVYRALSWHLYITPYRTNKADSMNRPAQWLELLLDHRNHFRDEQIV